MNTTQTITEQRPDAVVWIDERHALVAQRDADGRISTVEVRRVHQAENRYLAHVVHAIGAHEHVMIVGDQPIRLALERRFVAVGHRPDRLLASQPADRIAGARVAEGLARLAA